MIPKPYVTDGQIMVVRDTGIRPGILLVRECRITNKSCQPQLLQPAGTTMSNLRPQVRSALTSFLTSQDGYHLKTDVLRVIEEEARLMKETERVFDALDTDEMEQLGGIARQISHLKQQLRVSSYDKVRALDGYTRIEAVVDIEWKQNLMQLTFKYERKRRMDGQGAHVRYSIEYSANRQQRENLLVVEVWSPQDRPSSGRAICINQSLDHLNDEGEDDEEAGWEDIDDNNDDDVEAVTGKTKKIATTPKAIEDSSAPERPNQASKRQKLCDDNDVQGTKPGNLPCKNEDEDESTTDHDEYLAYLDPDLLHEFLKMANLQPMDEGTAFFFLMTFPFYDHEWDLVGFLLDEIFGGDEDDDDTNEIEDENKDSDEVKNADKD
jgi:hypothetical protein